MAILIKDMEIPDSCFLCRFCRRQEYGEYIGEDTAWECVASKKRITDGQDLIATFKHPDCPLVEVPDEQPDRNAQERYEDLCEYFKDCSDKGMGILRDRKEFKAWLERLHWHVVTCDELGRELEKLKSAQTERSSEIQDILEYLDKVLHPVISPDHWNVYSELHDMISMLPSAQPGKRTDKRTETHACDSVNRQAAIDAARDWYEGLICGSFKGLEKRLRALPSAQPEQRWIPVTKDTLPIEGKVVIVKGKTGTWDFGTYRGYSHVMGEGDIHKWNWKKNTLKSVYWWMYKDGALPEPTGGEQE